MQNQILDILTNTDEDMQEIVLKQSSTGSKLSMVVGKNLFQVIRFDKKLVLMHEFSITRNSVLGFKHHSFKTIHNWRLFIIFSCISSFAFISPISFTLTAPWYVADFVFLSSLGLLIFSIGNPHLLVFNTKSDRYSVFFFQWRSNKDNISNTLSNIGLAMSGFLVSGEFIMPNITYNIGRVGDNIGRIGDTVATDSVVMEEQLSTRVDE